VKQETTAADSPVAALAYHLRKLRVDQGMSQEDLGKACGMHRTVIARIERREANVSLTTLARLAEALHTAPDRLLEPIPKNAPLPPLLDRGPWEIKKQRRGRAP
jgi:transcriptional regulator with XRE-family HTH domain